MILLALALTASLETNPSPEPTAAPNCANPNKLVTITHAESPEFPDSALSPPTQYTVLELVHVGRTGEVLGASVYKSSGKDAADRAALRAAKDSTYSPKFEACRPVVGDFLFRVVFKP